MNRTDFLLSKLRRCGEPDGEFLDACWMAELPSATAMLAERVGVLKDELQDVEIYVAGKESGPSQKAVATAAVALSQLDKNYTEITESGIDPCEWPTINLWVPYQYVEIFYLRFWSDYGTEMDYAFKLKDCKFGAAGVYVGASKETTKISEVPGAVRFVLEELKEAGHGEALQALTQRIDREEVMGPEVLPELISIVEQLGNAIPDTAGYLSQLQPLLPYAPPN